MPAVAFSFMTSALAACTSPASTLERADIVAGPHTIMWARASLVVAALAATAEAVIQVTFLHVGKVLEPLVPHTPTPSRPPKHSHMNCDQSSALASAGGWHHRIGRLPRTAVRQLARSPHAPTRLVQHPPQAQGPHVRTRSHRPRRLRLQLSPPSKVRLRSLSNAPMPLPTPSIAVCPMHTRTCLIGRLWCVCDGSAQGLCHNLR